MYKIRVILLCIVCRINEKKHNNLHPLNTVKCFLPKTEQFLFWLVSGEVMRKGSSDCKTGKS